MYIIPVYFIFDGENIIRYGEPEVSDSTAKHLEEAMKRGEVD